MDEFLFKPGDILVFGNRHYYEVLAINDPFPKMYRLYAYSQERVVNKNMDSVHKALIPASPAAQVLYTKKRI